MANPASTTITFSPLTEAMSSAGQNYLVSVMVGTSFTTVSPASISVTISSSNEDFTPSSAFWEVCETDSGNAYQVLPNAASVFLSPTEATLFRPADGFPPQYDLPVPQGATGIPVVHFTLQASTGTQSVTGLDFTGDGTELAAATLYLDGGTVPGRVDAGDTMVATATTLSATNVTFTGLTESVTTTPSRYLLVVDVSATATTGSASTYSLAPGGVTAGVTTEGLTANGLVTPVDMSTDGVDVTVNLVTSTANLTGSNRVLIATCQQTARGAGGIPAGLAFDLLNGYGGVFGSTFVGMIALEVYLEGAGPVGQLDSSDTLQAFSDQTLRPNAVAQIGANDTPFVTSTVNMLVFLRLHPDACDFDGRYEVVFRGLAGGTEPAFASEPNYELIGGSVSIAATGGGGSGGGGGDGGGCSTSEMPGTSWMLMLGALSVLAVASRMRGSRA